MAFIEPEGVDLLKKYYVYERDIIPEVDNVYYTNTNYTSNLGFNGYNKFAARRPSSTGGWVLPNCTGYSYGRVLETCGLTQCDYIAGDASQWFDYNKNLFDNGNGGYPYIQLDATNRGYNLGGGFISDNSAIYLLKLILVMCRPGNVVCYSEGTSSLNGGMVFDEAGHVQTIEKIIADNDAYQKMQRDINIGNIVIVALGVIFGLAWAYNLTAPMAIEAWNNILRALELERSLRTGSNIEMVIAGWVVKGWCTEEQAMNFFQDIMQIVTIDDGQLLFFLSKEGVKKAVAINIWNILGCISSTLVIASAAGLGTRAAVHTLLDNINIETLPATVISQSSYNGYSSTSSIGLWNRDTIYFANAVQTVEGDPTLQGIILTPCQEPSQFARRGSFPWQLGNSIGLYD